MLRNQRFLFSSAVPHCTKWGKHKPGLNLCDVFRQETGQALGFSQTDINKNKDIT